MTQKKASLSVKHTTYSCRVT